MGRVTRAADPLAPQWRVLGSRRQRKSDVPQQKEDQPADTQRKNSQDGRVQRTEMGFAEWLAGRSDGFT